MKLLEMRFVRSSSDKAEVYTIDKHGTGRRYAMNIDKITCDYRWWQVTGLPCHHALHLICSLRGPCS